MPVADKLDSYVLRARLFPVAIVLMPLALGLGTWISTADFSGLWGGILAGLAVAALLAHIARDEGRRKQPALYKLWGEVPSIRALSYQAKVFDETTLRRFHAKLRSLDPSLVFPANLEDEIQDVKRSKAAYNSANEMLLSKTRNRENFRLVFEENTSYGFRRNLWAMKASGIATSSLGALVGAWRIAVDISSGGEPSTPALVTVAVSAALFAVWVVRIRPSWVKLAADSFGKQLVRSCDMLPLSETTT